MKIIAIIPARLQSSRLPEKVLVDIGGKSIIQRVYEQATNAKVFDQVIVATDHQKIVDHCNALQMDVQMTSDSHISGTDRIAEVAQKIEADIIINIQGDEPFIEVECIQDLVQLLKQSRIKIGTLCKRIDDGDSIFDFNTVKLVKDQNGKVLYFSRQAIPGHRDLPFRKWKDKTDYYQHLGLYGFKRETLLEIVNLPPGNLELAEKLEQLRWLQNGYEIFCTEVQSKSFGIDTQENLEKARAIYK